MTKKRVRKCRVEDKWKRGIYPEREVPEIIFARRIKIFYCTSLRQEMGLKKCHRCGESYPNYHFRKSKHINGKTLDSICYECHCFMKRGYKDRKTHSQLSKICRENALRGWDRIGRPKDTISMQDWRKYLPEKKKLNTNYPVWE